MGKTILTPSQSLVLQLVARDKIFGQKYFLSGGTALSEFYLHHRLSEDIDFFTHEEIDYLDIQKLAKNIEKKIQTIPEIKKRAGFFRYTYAGDFGLLKIDFMHQLFKQLEHHKNIAGIYVASIWDILVDKLYTIFQRANARDFVDLYYGMRQVDCDINQMLQGMQQKYEAQFDKMSLLSRLPAVKDVHDYPKMLVSFDPKKMEQFFLNQTKKLEKLIFK